MSEPSSALIAAKISSSIHPDKIAEIMTAVGQASYVWDIGEDSIGWSENFFNLIGFRNATDVCRGREFEKLLSTESQETRFAAIYSAQCEDPPESGVSYQCVYAVSASHLKGDVSVWLEDTGRWYPDEFGKPAHAEGTVRIINERRQREETLRRRSDFDNLTKLYNRRYLEEHINQTIDAAITEHRQAALLMINICDLEQVNDIYGFSSGDEVLLQAASLLTAQTRSDDIVARFSGAKFAVVINNCSTSTIYSTAKRITDYLNTRLLHTKAGPVSIRAAIGACLLPGQARTPIDAVSHSLSALQIARADHSMRVAIFDPDPQLNEKQRRNALQAAELVRAFETNMVHFAFQPVVESSSHRVAYHEALLRKNKSEMPLLEDADIISTAENLGLMRMVDNHVLELALEMLATHPDARLSINITHESLENPDWISRLASGFATHNLTAGRLIIELTESQIPRSINETQKIIDMIRDIGCKVAIDDFGAGYTSFSNLKNLNIDILKIDGSFCRDLKQEPRNEVFLKALLDLAKTFQVETVVEWVEDSETAAKLEEWGFDYLQGKAFGMPLPIAPWEKSSDPNTNNQATEEKNLSA